MNGDSTIKDIVAHLNGWQPRLIASLQAAQASEPDPSPPWPAHLQTEDEINAWIFEVNRGRSVREVLDESHQRRLNMNIPWKTIIMRHVQEHAAQLNLFLGQNGVSAPDWVTKAGN